MRKKAGSWIIKVILFVIVVVFIFWGFGSYRNKQTTQVAEINGTVITFDSYYQFYQNLLEQYRRIYGGRLDDNMLKMLRLKEVALDNSVQRVLMLQEAERLGITANEKEVANNIYQMQAFQRDGVFNPEQYRYLLASNNIATEVFEKDQKEMLIIERLRNVILDGITISEADAHQWYDWQNTQINLSYIVFSPDSYKDISPSDVEISAYFNDHQNDYLTAPQVKVRYLFFDPKAQEPKINISGEDIERYYYSHSNDFFTEKTVQARHILFKLDPESDEATVEKQYQKAMEVYQLAQNGKSFSELAKEYSEGPSASKGGDLGTFTKDTMVKPFADKAFSMESGQISEPVRTQFGWHIIKVEKVNPATTQSIESASDDIKKKLLREKSLELALEKAEEVYDSLFDGDDLSLIETNDEILMGTTEFFTSNKPPQINGTLNRNFADAALNLEKFAISDVLEAQDGYYLLQITDRIEPSVPPLEEVNSRVRADVVKMQQEETAKTQAQAAQAELMQGKTLTDIAATHQIAVAKTGFFGRNGAIPGIGYEQEISDIGFSLSEKQPTAKNAVQSQKGWVVFSLNGRKAPDTGGFPEQKDSIIERLTSQKKQAAFETWIEDLKSRGEIKINYDLIR